jgi:hypothetical protein
MDKHSEMKQFMKTYIKKMQHNGSRKKEYV